MKASLQCEYTHVDVICEHRIMNVIETFLFPLLTVSVGPLSKDLGWSNLDTETKSCHCDKPSADMGQKAIEVRPDR